MLPATNWSSQWNVQSKCAFYIAPGHEILVRHNYISRIRLNDHILLSIRYIIYCNLWIHELTLLRLLKVHSSMAVGYITLTTAKLTSISASKKLDSLDRQTQWIWLLNKSFHNCSIPNMKFLNSVQIIIFQPKTISLSKYRYITISFHTDFTDRDYFTV